MKKPIYLDYNATTPVDPAVLAAMHPFFSEAYGNAASSHAYGLEARQAVEQAREEIARMVHAQTPETIVFTSGATESNNLALKGFAQANRHKGKHIISHVAEHSSVRGPLKELSEMGFAITDLTCDPQGLVHPPQVERAITPQTILVSILYANNEIGTIQPIAEIGKICRRKGVVFHTDAVQAVGKIDVDVERDQIDLLSCNAHKMYGPKGIGALYIAPQRPLLRLQPLVTGGGHERGLRSGTLAVPLIVGFGKAAEVARESLAANQEKIRSLRELFWNGLQGEIAEIHLNGHPTLTLPGTLNISFDGVESENLLQEFSELALSSGSACTSAKPEPSHVLTAIGLNAAQAQRSLRFCIGKPTTTAEIQEAIAILAKRIRLLRK